MALFIEFTEVGFQLPYRGYVNGTIFFLQGLTTSYKKLKRKKLTDPVFTMYFVWGDHILGQVVVYKEHIKLGLLRFFQQTST